MRIALVNLPVYEHGRPPMAPAILKSLVEYPNTSDCFDFNQKMFKDVTSSRRLEFENWCDYGPTNEVDKTMNPGYDMRDLFSNYAKEVQWYDAVAISVFTEKTQRACKLFCEELRQLQNGNKVRVLIGGTGTSTQRWVRTMQEAGLIDDFIAGEGEEAFVQYINGNKTYPGINNWNYEQIDDLDALPFPNYSQFNRANYPLNELYITGSRGCVRKCTYCDVPALWKKYRYRSGENIAEEMFHHYNLNDYTKFWFTDSLVNGSQKAFREMCETLIARRGSHESFQWKGQYIFRPKRTCNEEYFRLTAQAGGKEFYVGLESGSDRIRWAMDKKFTNEDVDYQLEMFKKYGITCQLLMIGGHPEETKEDHKENLAMFKRWQKYVASGTIVGIELGNVLHILPNTPLEKLNLDFATENNASWYNENSSLKLRINRRIEIQEEAMKYYWPITNSHYRLNYFSHLLDE
jgi:radical SAM superfamily enzyme YgiQ (UPF0313 family)